MDDRTDADACGHFVSKWQAREPEMRIAEVFCDPAQKLRFNAWGALLHEVREAIFELSDPQVTTAKVGWWAEELAGSATGRPRHPLMQALRGIEAPWSALGRQMLESVSRPATLRAADTSQAIEFLLPLAHAATDVEAAIFACAAPASAARSLARHWLLQRLPHGLAADDQARLPMHLLARHGTTAAQLAAALPEKLVSDWARELTGALPVQLNGGAFIRRSCHRFDQARLRRLAAVRGFGPPAGLVTLWQAWRAARNH